MADDQKPKTMDINDLVRELSKSSTSPATPTPPLAPASQVPRPSFSTPKPTMPSPMAGPAPVPFIPKPTAPAMPTPPPATPPQPKPLEMPKPQFNTPPIQPKPVPPPVGGPSSVNPLPAPGVKEYQSSIRTMNEDISKIKQGQQPTGVPVPRKVEQVVPAPQPMPPKPAAPTPQFKVPSANLGESQKTGPLAPSRNIPGIPRVPPATPPAPKIGGAVPAPQIYVPESGSKGGNRNMLFIGIGAAVLVAGFAYWFFVLRLPAPEVVIESPTPTPTKTPVPTPTPTLVSIFSAAQRQDISIKSTNTLSVFVSDISKVFVDPGTFKIVSAVDVQTPSISYDFIDLVTKLSLKVPSELISNFDTDSAMFIYGQRESFDSKGNLQVGVTAPNRVAMIAKLKSPADVFQTMKNWETTISSDLKVFFGLGTANKDQSGFLDNTYRGVSIRYRNFPYSDKTIDYAIVSASNDKAYLVITDSRESIFAIIDRLITQ